jgi:hypothetical protein
LIKLKKNKNVKNTQTLKPPPLKKKKKINTDILLPSKIKSLEKNPEVNGTPHKHNKQTKIETFNTLEENE